MTPADLAAPNQTQDPIPTPAIRYDRRALIAGLKRRRANIQVFRQAIKTEQGSISDQKYMISQIDRDHPDVKVLKKNILKRRVNIATFRQAIKEERELIKKERAMAISLRQNR